MFRNDANGNHLFSLFTTEITIFFRTEILFFIRQLFSSSTENVLAFSEFQYQNFLKTFLAKLLSFTFCACSLEESEKAPGILETMINVTKQQKQNAYWRVATITYKTFCT